MNLLAEQSIFSLNDDEQQTFQQLLHYDLYFYLLRQPFASSRFSHALMHDIALYFYLPSTPIYNHPLTLLHPLRYEIVKCVISEERFSRIKGYTQHDPVLALFTASLITNMYIDILHIHAAEVDHEQAALFHHFNDGIEQLFEISSQKNEPYPKKFVQLETRILQALRTYIQHHPDAYTAETIKIHRMLDQYVLRMKELYEVELGL